MDVINNFTLQFHITDRCPNQCLHCYKNENFDDLGIKEIEKIFLNIEDFKKKYNASISQVNITGGAPLIRNDWFKIVELIGRKNKNIVIMDIPEHVTPNNIKILKELNVSAYQVSIDGMQENHDIVRGKGSFEKTIESIDLLNQNGITIFVMYTVNNKNYNDLLPLIDYFEQKKLDVVFAFDFVVCQGNAKNSSISLLSENIRTIIDKYYAKYKENQKRNTTVKLKLKSALFSLYTCDGVQDMLAGKYPYVSGCGLGWNTLTVMPDGTVYPCRRLPIRLGNLCEDSFEDIFLNNGFMRKMRRKNNFVKCGLCSYYEFCRGCPAIEYGNTGDAFGGETHCLQNFNYHVCHNTENNELEWLDPLSADDEYKLIANTFQNKVCSFMKNPTMDYFKSLLILKNEKDRQDFILNRDKWLKKIT